MEKEIFKKYTADYKKLIAYGFAKTSEGYCFEKLFLNNEFRAKITITEDGNIKGLVYDVANNDEYLPFRNKYHQGAFTGEIRKQYESILNDIRDNCFTEKLFISPQSNRIAELIFEEYGDKPVFMWEKFPTYGVFKNSSNGKWYGIIMYIPYSKLGENSDSYTEIINLKSDNNKINDILKQDGFYPAWHMNKKSWITIVLDNSVSDEVLMKYVKESYNNVKSKIKQKRSKPS